MSSFIPHCLNMLNLKSVLHTCLCTVGGREETRKNPTQTRGEHANATQKRLWHPGDSQPLAVRQQRKALHHCAANRRH